jgi:UDP-glucose 4-epimerase
VVLRVLITGGAGFIGSSLAGALLLLKKNYHVTVLDNLSRGHLKNISKWLGSPRFEFVQGDLLDYSTLNPSDQKAPPLQKIVDNSDIIFHLAANPDVAIGTVNTHIDFQQNVQATYILLEAIRKSQRVPNSENVIGGHRRKKKVIFASSSTVYGKANKRPTPENYSPLYPISLYGSTKLACEAIISGYCHMFDIYGIVARLANIIGPRNAHGVIYDFITKLSVRPDSLDILGNSQQNKSYLYIDDCVNALILLSESMQKNSESRIEAQHNVVKQQEIHAVKSSANEIGNLNDKNSDLTQYDVFNIGSDDTITVMQIAKIVIDQLSLKNGNVKIEFKNSFRDGRGWQGDIPDFWLDCSKLKGVGWKPKYSSRDAVLRTCKEYNKSGVANKR